MLIVLVALAVTTIAGYIIEYVRPGVAGVMSEALTYRKPGAARIVSTDRAAMSYLSRVLHGRVARAPRAAPGQARIMIEGTLRGLPCMCTAGNAAACSRS